MIGAAVHGERVGTFARVRGSGHAGWSLPLARREVTLPLVHFRTHVDYQLVRASVDHGMRRLC
jgi:hypothetical protein